MAFLNTDMNTLARPYGLYDENEVGLPIDIRNICEYESDITSEEMFNLYPGPGILVYVTSTKQLFVIDKLNDDGYVDTKENGGYHEIGGGSSSTSAPASTVTIVPKSYVTSGSEGYAAGTAGVTYLVEKDASDPTKVTGDNYTEYIWTGESYEKLGAEDLENATTEELNDAFDSVFGTTTD